MNKKRRIVEAREEGISKFLATPKDNTNVHSYVDVCYSSGEIFLSS